MDAKVEYLALKISELENRLAAAESLITVLLTRASDGGEENAARTLSLLTAMIGVCANFQVPPYGDWVANALSQFQSMEKSRADGVDPLVSLAGLALMGTTVPAHQREALQAWMQMGATDEVAMDVHTALGQLAAFAKK